MNVINTYTIASLTAFTLTIASGCGKQQEPATPAPIVDAPVIPVTPTTPSVKDIQDVRTRWVYEKGWFVKGVGDSWYEHNDEALRIRGKAWEFRQTKSSTDHVELYDASRGVTVRLGESTAEARWDKDGMDAAWGVLFPGKWDPRK